MRTFKFTRIAVITSIAVGLHLLLSAIVFAQITTPKILEPSKSSSNSNPIITCSKRDTLIGNMPNYGANEKGYWTYFSPASVSPKFLSDSTNDTVYVELPENVTILFQWQIRDVNENENNAANVFIRNGLPTMPNAGEDTTICTNSFQLRGNKISAGSGKWLTNNASITFSPSNTAYNATVNNLPKGPNKFIWQSSSSCPNVFKDSVIISNEAPSPAIASTPSNSICKDTALLNATSPTYGVGKWEVPIGVSIDKPNSINAKIWGNFNQVTVYWEVSTNSICPNSNTAISLTKYTPQTATIFNKSSIDTTICKNTLKLSASSPTSGTGTWITSANISDPNKPDATVSNLPNGVTMLKWRIANGTCSPSEASITIHNHSVTKPITTPDSCILSSGSNLVYELKLKQPLGAGESGIWKAVNHSTSSINLQNNLGSRSATFQSSGSDHYDFVFATSNGTCKDSSSTKYIILTKATLPADKCLFSNGNTPTKVGVRALLSPNKNKGEKGSFLIIGSSIVTNTTFAEDSVMFDAPPGIYTIEYTISNTNTCSNKDVMTVTILERAKVNAISGLCIMNTSKPVSAILPSLSDSVRWSSSDNIINFSNKAAASSIANNLKIGKNTLYWSVHVNGCKSQDSIVVSRLTRPDIGPDLCFAPDLKLGEDIDTVEGKSNIAASEKIDWGFSPGLKILTTADNKKAIIKASPNQSYILTYKISTFECQGPNGFSDTLRVSFLTKPAFQKDTFFVKPFEKQPVIESKEVISSSEYPVWYSSGGDSLVKSTAYSIPVTISPGKKTYSFRIKNQFGCSFGVTKNVWIISKPKILSKPCLQESENYVALRADSTYDSTVETGEWTYDTKKHSEIVTSTVAFKPFLLNVYNLDTTKYVFYWNVSTIDKKYTIRDSIVLTNLTNPQAINLKSTCAIGSSFFLNPISLKLQPYEKARWIITSSNGKVKVGNSLIDSIVNITPGLVKVALVIRDTTSTCADTSNAITINAISTPNVQTKLKCLIDTISTLEANKLSLANEKGSWTFLKGFQAIKSNITISDSTANITTVKGLGKRDNSFMWKISSNYNTNCFAVDSLKLVVNMVATINSKNADSCLVKSDSINLSGNTPDNYLRSLWIFRKDTLARTPLFSYKNLSAGTSSFIYHLVDPLYPQCATRDTIVLHSIPKASIDSANSCLIKNNPNVNLASIVKVRRNAGSSTSLGYWSSTFDDQIYKIDSNSTEVRYKFELKSVGKKTFYWNIRSVSNPTCYSRDTLEFNILPVPSAGIDKCITNDFSTLEADSTHLKNGVTATWKVIGSAKISDSTRAKINISNIAKGVTNLIWRVSLGSCQSLDSVKINHITKATTAGVQCLNFEPDLEIPLKGNTIAATETGEWINESAIQVSNVGGVIVAKGFKLGENKLIWRIKSKTGPTCISDSSLSYHLFTPSGFEVDTLPTCSKETIVKFNPQQLTEQVEWRGIPSYKQKILSDSTFQLKELSNDTIYTIYRLIKYNNRSIGCAPLVDSIKIINNQLDSSNLVITLPNEVFEENKTLFTCSPNLKIFVKDPHADRSTSRFSLAIQQPSLGASIVDIGKENGNIRYDAINMNNESVYTFLYSIKNMTCPTLRTEISINKKLSLTNFPTVPLKDTICGDTFVSVKNLSLFPQLFPQDSLYWYSESPGVQIISNKSERDLSKVKVLTAVKGINEFDLEVTRVGCKGRVKMEILSDKGNYDINIDPDSSVLHYCNKEEVDLVGKHNHALNAGDRFVTYWTRRKSIRDTEGLNQVLPFNNTDTTNHIKVISQVYDVPQKYYFISQNGVCPLKIDSIVVINNRPVQNFAVINKNNNPDTICANQILLESTPPLYGKGIWRVNHTTPYFSAPSDNITWLINLIPSPEKYKVFREVENGVCKAIDSILFTVGPPLALPVIESDFIQVCDSSYITLKAAPLSPGLTGVWLDINGIIISDTIIAKVPIPKDVNKSFYWRITNQFCNATARAEVISFSKPSSSYAGEDISVILNNATLTANTPTIGKGKWIVTLGGAVIENDSIPHTSVRNLSAENEFAWQIANGVCPVAIDYVKVHFSDFAIPSGFSPNGDRKNDFFEIKGLENYPNTKLKVFNRWGMEVFSSMDYKNDWDAEGLQDDTYYYELLVPNANKKHGYLVVKRK